MTPPRIWILIADGERARVVTTHDRGATFRTEWAIDSTEAHHRSAELGADKPGRSYESASTARHAITPKHDLHDQAKQRFVQFLARELEHRTGEFDQLGLIAPPRAMRDLVLDDQTARKVMHTLHKDLTRVPDHRLGQHVADWFLPPR